MISYEKWIKLSFFEQMGNIGSEISRINHWGKKGDIIRMKTSCERVLGLIDLSIKSNKNASQLRELTILREVICDLFVSAGNYDCSPEMIEKYCLYFGLKANMDRLNKLRMNLVP